MYCLITPSFQSEDLRAILNSIKTVHISHMPNKHQIQLYK